MRKSARHAPGRLAVLSSLTLAGFLLVAPSAGADHAGSGIDVRTYQRTVRGERVTVATHDDPVAAFKPRKATAFSADSTATGAAAGPVEANDAVPGIATTWCGTERSSDDATNETGNTSSPKYRAIYAYPSDRTSRLTANGGAYADMIQGDVKAIEETVAAVPGSSKSVRFDLGTSCGSGYVDITSVQMAHTTSYLESPPSGSSFGAIGNDVKNALGSSPVKRNYMIYSDYVTSGAAGTGSLYYDQDPSSQNANNLGDAAALIYYRPSYWDATGSSGYVTYRRDTVLHEITHNLGAVQPLDPDTGDAPPHTSALAHCYDEYDLMCYDDDFDSSTYPLTYPCPDFQVYDCGSDDYFNPNPPSGSYLATHWNSYNSVFLCALSSCAPGSPPTTPDTFLDAATGPPQGGTTNDPTPTFSFSSTKQTATFQCMVESAYDDAGGTWGTCSSPQTTAPITTDGPQTFSVKSIDNGVEDPYPASRTFILDTVAPDTTISSGPSSPRKQRTATFNFHSDEPNAAFICRLDSGSYTVCGSPTSVSGLADGTHSFSVWAVDAAQNIDPTPAIWTFKVDTVPPQTTITSAPAATTTDRTPTFRFRSSETGSKFVCSLDGTGYRSCSSPKTTGPLSYARHIFKVRGKDRAGNYDQTPAIRRFTVKR